MKVPVCKKKEEQDKLTFVLPLTLVNKMKFCNQNSKNKKQKFKFDCFAKKLLLL